MLIVVDGVLTKYEYDGEDKVIIPDGVVIIESGAFLKSKAKEVVMPHTLRCIHSNAFRGAAIERVTIPHSVISLENHAFSECKQLKKVVFEEPFSLSTIPDNCFVDCSSLEEVALPDSIMTIGAFAFSNCTSLKSIYIPYYIRKIKMEAFAGAGLTKLFISSGTGVSIENRAFWQCKDLALVNLGHGVTEIGEYAFYDCCSLQSISFDDDVCRMGRAAFWECPRLASVVLPLYADATCLGAFEEHTDIL